MSAADLSPRMAAALRCEHPLIVFNTCCSGRLGFSLTRLGAWWARFVHLGCGGFLCTLWPVTDRAALRQAVSHQLSQVIFAGMAGKLTKLAAGVLMTHYTRSKVSLDLLKDITLAVGGGADLAGQVAGANTARHAAELWDQAGLLPAAGRELCARAARVLHRFAAELAGPARQSPRIRVIMVDFTGQAKIAEATAEAAA